MSPYGLNGQAIALHSVGKHGLHSKVGRETEQNTEQKFELWRIHLTGSLAAGRYAAFACLLVICAFTVWYFGHIHGRGVNQSEQKDPWQATVTATEPPGESEGRPRGMTPRIIIGSTRTTLVIGLERPVEFETFALAQPNRVFIEMPDVQLELPNLPNEGGGLIKSVRAGLSRPGKARVVIDVAGPVLISRAIIEHVEGSNSARLVIELTADPNAKAMAGSQAYGSDRSALGTGELDRPMGLSVSPRVRRAGLLKSVIVIDPGHGGDDYGALNRGTAEKDVALAFSLRLRVALSASGRYKVLMTRESDMSVSLAERRRFAEKNLTELLVSVHADSVESGPRGATIYSLRRSVGAALHRSADGITSSDVRAEGDVRTIRDMLEDLTRRESDLPRHRATVFIKTGFDFIRGSLKSNSDGATLLALKSAAIPSILLELGYGVDEAGFVKSEIWHERVVASVVTAIENYFSYNLAQRCAEELYSSEGFCAERPNRP